MGMFDKDKEIGTIITTVFQLREHFIVWGVRIRNPEYPTPTGTAVQSELTVSKLDNPGEKFEATTLASAIGAKIPEAEASDFPAVCCLAKVPGQMNSEALVLQFLKPYTGAVVA